VAGLTFSPNMRGQFAAIARVRWQLFVNSMRTIRGRMEVVARGFTFLAFGMGGFVGSIAIGFTAWYFVSSGRADWLPLLLWPVFLFWQFVPVMASAFTENVDSSNLLRFPLTFPSYFLIRIAYGSLDPPTLMGCLWLLGMAVGIGCASPLLFLPAAGVLLLFAIFNILLARMLFTWAERWLAQRRAREILGVLFLFMVIGFQFIGPLVRHYGNRSHQPALSRVVVQALPIERLTPPGLAGLAIAHSLSGDYAFALGSFALFCGYTLAVLWLLNVRLRAQYLGENLSEAVARTAAPTPLATQKIHLGWNIPGVPGVISAVVEKEIHYLSRSGPMLFTLVMPLVVLLIFRFTPGKSDSSAGMFGHSADLAFPVGAAYAVLILTNLVFNSFGAEAGGIQFYFVSPVRFREILMGKNLTHSLLLALEMVLVCAGASLMYRPPPWDIALATVTGVFFALVVNLTVGNLLSVYSPKKIDLGALGRQRTSQVTALASLGIQAVVLGLCALALLAARAYQHIWLAAVIFLALAAIATVFYSLVLNRIDAIVQRRREAMIAELCRA
jgi:ABC-2 type transport system permease protein